MEEFVQNYCTCETDNKTKHIVEHHVTEILTNTLRPIFKKQITSHRTLTRRPEAKYASVADDDLHEDQLWKSENYVDILIWIVRNVSTEDLEKNLHLIIPPVLIVLDDYDVLYKEQGVKMVHQMIKKLDSKNTASLGLDNLFFESLFKCLTYISQERDVPLLKATYPCILDLIGSLKTDKRSKANLYERVLKEGVINGFIYAGQKFEFLPILLEPLPVLHQELGIISVQYLKAILPVVCEALAMTSSKNPVVKNINTLAANALITIIKKCWPRIPYYKGMIMQSIAKSWMHYYELQDKIMCDLIRKVYEFFTAACQGQDEADKNALIALNPAVFSQLF